MLLSVFGIAIVGVVCITIFKEVKPTFALYVSIAASFILVGVIIVNAQSIINKFSTYLAGLKVNSELFYFLLKVIGISFIIEFVVDIVEECGAKSIANKVKVIGKIVITSMSLPILFDLLDLIMDLV